MLLEDAPRSNAPVRPRQPHFKVFPEFDGASYAKRYELLMTKLVRARLYDAGCLILSARDRGRRGEYREPTSELSFRVFMTSLLGRAIAVAQMQPPGPPSPPIIEVGPAKDGDVPEST